jgi:DNA-binding response OmpR family regulator
MPTLVVLDLKLPKVSGLEVLQWIRTQPELAQLRVIILSSSNRQSNKDAAAARRADEYFVKPGHFDNWMKMVTTLKTSWLEAQRA